MSKCAIKKNEQKSKKHSPPGLTEPGINSFHTLFHTASFFGPQPQFCGGGEGEVVSWVE